MLLAQFGNPVRLIIVFLIACTLVIIKAAEDKNANSIADKENIIKTIKKLSSPDFKTRESATEDLWKLGRSAEPLL